MIRKITLSAIAALGLGAPALAAESGHVHDFAFSFEGPFGTYDQMQLQRGLQLYTEICASCHGLIYVPIRTLGDAGGPHLPEDQVRAYATTLEVFDPELNDTRTAEPTDHFPASALESAPDLSVMAKARAGFHGPYGTGISQLFNGIGGPEYIATLLSSYEESPACAPEDFPGYYNTAFTSGGIPDACRDDHGHSTVPGSWIAMAPPLSDDVLEFADHSPTDVESMAQDAAAFLMWTAEPKLNARKENGFVIVLFLILVSVLLYLTNKRLWATVKRKDVTPAE